MFCSRCGTEMADGSKFCPSCGLDISSTSPVAAVKKEAESEADLVRDALKDEYEVLTELGRGGMAIVFKAREKALDREVAVKVLPFSLAFDAEFVERFQREARTAAKLEHPHIIPIYRVGKSGRVIYFVMKFLRGQSLSEIVEEQGAMPPKRIRKLLIQTVGALGYAHKNGIVHRDIKPDNIMFDESDNAIVTDFGIAKAASGTRLTGTGMSIGTPHYMSPEQARAQPLDGRSDIYSLGVVAFQCLTGGVPFDGEDSFAIGYKHIMEELPVPPLQTPEHRELYGIIYKMMAKQPDDRFQSAAELVATLEGHAPVPQATTVGRPASADAPTTVMPATPAGTRPGFAPTTPTTPVPKAEPRVAAPPKKRGGGVLVGMFTAVLLGGGGAGWYFLMGPGAGTGGATVQPAPEDTASVIVAGGDTLSDSARAVRDDVRADSVRRANLPQVGWITVGGIPSRGATITIDGEPFGGPVMQVPPGSRQVRGERAGYETFQTMVPVERGDTASVEIAWQQVQTAQRPERPAQRAEPVNYCEGAGERYNQDGSCFDQAPRMITLAILDSPEGVIEQPSPSVVWVLVGADGSAKEVQPVRSSNVYQFEIAARKFARDAEYRPATKNGRAVDAWYQFRIVARTPGS